MSPMFVPGPVDVVVEVLQQQTKPMLPHRSKDFEAIFQRAIDKLRQVFYTQYRVFIMTNSGSGAQEACVRNLAKERVLSLEGQGIASKLVKAALDEARTQHLAVVPICRFVAAYIRRHSEYRDLVYPDFRHLVEGEPK